MAGLVSHHGNRRFIKDIKAAGAQLTADSWRCLAFAQFPGYKLLAEPGQKHHALQGCRPAAADIFIEKYGADPYRNGDAEEYQAENGLRGPTRPAGCLIHGDEYGREHYDIGGNANQGGVQGLAVTVHGGKGEPRRLPG